jgi:hypothetical protein
MARTLLHELDRAAAEQPEARRTPAAGQILRGRGTPACAARKVTPPVPAQDLSGVGGVGLEDGVEGGGVLVVSVAQRVEACVEVGG